MYVIDAKRFARAKVTVRRSGGLFGPSREQLMISGRDKTALVGAMQWQVAAVRATLDNSAEFVDVPIVAALCFVDADLPLLAPCMSGMSG